MDPKELNKMWGMLDDLARNDPAGYKKYLQNMKEQALVADRVVKPGYYVKCLASDDSKVYLNICKTKAVSVGSDPLTISTLMSDPRKMKCKSLAH